MGWMSTVVLCVSTVQCDTVDRGSAGSVFISYNYVLWVEPAQRQVHFAEGMYPQHRGDAVPDNNKAVQDPFIAVGYLTIPALSVTTSNSLPGIHPHAVVTASPVVTRLWRKEMQGAL